MAGLVNDVLLFNAPPWGIHEPHLGLAYLSTFLKSRGYDPGVYDLNIDVFNRLDSEQIHLWDSNSQPSWVNLEMFHSQTLPQFSAVFDEAVTRMLTTPYRAIAFSVTAGNRLASIEIIKRLKASDPERLILVGGVGCSTHKERLIFLPPGLVDAFIVGEGEETMTALLDGLRRANRLQPVPGSIVWLGNGYSEPAPRPLIKDLDTIPYPTFDEFPLDEYFYSRKDLTEFTMKHVPMMTSRGCVNRCSFCNDVSMWTSYRFRSGQNVAEEMLYEAKKRNITHFVFQDLTVNGNLKQLESLCEILKKDVIERWRFPIQWISNCIARRVMTYERLRNMKAAGCHTLMFGIESGNDRILKLMRKGYTSDTASRVLKDCHEAGIKVWVNLIVGFPSETEAEFMDTINFVRRNRDYIDKVQNLNVCNVVDSAELDRQPDKYHVVLPEHEMAYLHWESADGTNTYEMRKRRMRELESVVHELGIATENYNVRGEEGKIQTGQEEAEIAWSPSASLP